jgi:phosphatidylserine/phosphatidylglycerophosphate/cardiolipin synthase-like enzyme
MKAIIILASAAIILLCYLLIGCPENSHSAHFCHEEDCTGLIIAELSKAEKEVVFAAYTFTHPSLATQLILNAHNNLAVRGVIEKQNINGRYSQYSALVEQGLDIRADRNSALMHHKFFVIDNSTVITGSFNPTKNADRRNDDNLVIIKNKETALLYRKEFERLWEKTDENT